MISFKTDFYGGSYTDQDRLSKITEWIVENICDLERDVAPDARRWMISFYPSCLKPGQLEIPASYVLDFRDESDAILFKLTWL